MRYTFWRLIGVWGFVGTVDGAISTYRGESHPEGTSSPVRLFKLEGHEYLSSITEKPLGFGGFGVVYAALQLPDRTPVALKCSDPPSELDEDTSVSGPLLAHEVGIVRSLNGYSWNLDLIDYKFTAEFECAAFHRGGPTIAKFLQEKKLTDCRFLAIADRMRIILAELHAEGITHGDVHIGNWLLGDPNDLSTLKLIDFDSATRFPPESYWETSAAAVEGDFNGVKRMLVDVISRPARSIADKDPLADYIASIRAAICPPDDASRSS